MDLIVDSKNGANIEDEEDRNDVLVNAAKGLNLEKSIKTNVFNKKNIYLKYLKIINFL